MISTLVETDACYFKRTFADREIKKMPSAVAFVLSAGEGRVRRCSSR